MCLLGGQYGCVSCSLRARSERALCHVGGRSERVLCRVGGRSERVLCRVGGRFERVLCRVGGRFERVSCRVGGRSERLPAQLHRRGDGHLSLARGGARRKRARRLLHVRVRRRGERAQKPGKCLSSCRYDVAARFAAISASCLGSTINKNVHNLKMLD